GGALRGAERVVVPRVRLVGGGLAEAAHHERGAAGGEDREAEAITGDVAQHGCSLGDRKKIGADGESIRALTTGPDCTAHAAEDERRCPRKPALRAGGVIQPLPPLRSAGSSPKAMDPPAASPTHWGHAHGTSPPALAPPVCNPEEGPRACQREIARL